MTSLSLHDLLLAIAGFDLVQLEDADASFLDRLHELCGVLQMAVEEEYARADDPVEEEEPMG